MVLDAYEEGMFFQLDRFDEVRFCTDDEFVTSLVGHLEELRELVVVDFVAMSVSLGGFFNFVDAPEFCAFEDAHGLGTKSHRSAEL